MTRKPKKAARDPRRVCAVIPTFNNSGTLSRTVKDTLRYLPSVIVVNDGSTDSTPLILHKFGKAIAVVTFPRNRGKGAAIRAGLKRAEELGFEFAVTIDSDGQHFASDIPKFLKAVKPGEKALVIGKRDMTGKDVPESSVFGRKFSNFWTWLETGLKVGDAQSGYRLYTVAEMNRFHFITKRYDFEIESLVRWAWKGYKVRTVPIGVYYPPAKDRVSHFHKFKDNARLTLLNTLLVTTLLVWVLPARLVKRLFKGK